VATNIEARAIINEFKLQKIQNETYKIYANNNTTLIVTNIGIKNAKKATSYIIKYLGAENISHFYNIGIAGCVDKNIKIGSMFFINKIIHKEIPIHINNKNIASHFNQCSISSFLNPVMQIQAKDIKSKLVDMEAIGFFEIVSKQTPKSNKYIIKIVSDYLLENNVFDKNIVIDLIEKNIKDIQYHISSI